MQEHSMGSAEARLRAKRSGQYQQSVALAIDREEDDVDTSPRIHASRDVGLQEPQHPFEQPDR